MSRQLKTVLGAALASACLCVPALSSAALAPTERVVPAPQGSAAAAPESLLQQMALAAPSEQGDALSLDAAVTPVSPPLRLQAAAFNVPLRAHSDLALWNLVATIHAQQKNQSFELVDAGLATVWDFERDKVSAVPLPGVMWLFIMGLLGLAGTRVTGVASVARSRETGPALGTLAPA